MPPAAQQGSRAGLITALVIFVILFVTTTILWIYQNAEATRLSEELARQSQKYAPAVSDEDLASPAYTALAGADGGAAGQTAFQRVVAQRAALAKAITGSDTAAAQALLSAQDAIKAATAKPVTEAGLTLPSGTSLTAAVRALAQRVGELQNQKTQLATQLAAANTRYTQTVAAREALLKERDAQIAELTTRHEAAVAELKQYQEQSTTRVTGIETSAQEQISTINKTATKLSNQVKTQQGQIAVLTKENEQLRARLTNLRPVTNEGAATTPDGQIIRLPNESVAHVDLGMGDQVVPGMTFEVYDKYTGIPALGDGQREGELPVGKASIEIIRVGPVSSEARIIRRTRGEALVEGDLISNLVYDPKTKYNFVVYGDFDMNRDGRASTADGEVLKRLVTQWGSNVQDQVNVDTDFLVLGKEPVVPDLTDEDEGDPLKIQERDEADARLTAYNKVRERALDLNVPILNQNRFLYLVGYYNQASR